MNRIQIRKQSRPKLIACIQNVSKSIDLCSLLCYMYQWSNSSNRIPRKTILDTQNIKRKMLVSFKEMLVGENISEHEDRMKNMSQMIELHVSEHDSRIENIEFNINLLLIGCVAIILLLLILFCLLSKKIE